MAITNKVKTKTKSLKKQQNKTKESKPVLQTGINAKQFIEKLKTYQSAEELKKIQRYFKSGEGQYSEGDKFMGVKMGQLFTLAKEFNGMPIIEIEKLLDSIWQ
jgi:hypothetical protein